MDKDEKMTGKEKSEKMVLFIDPITSLVDMTLDGFDFEHAKTVSDKFHDHASHLGAASVITYALGRDGIAEEQDAKDRADFWDAIVNLYKIRKRQKETAIKKVKDEGRNSKILKQMGIL